MVSLSDGILREIHRPTAGAAAVFAGSLLPATAAVPAPAPIAQVTPRKVTAETPAESEERVNRPVVEGTITIRSARSDRRADVDLLAFNPVVVD